MTLFTWFRDYVYIPLGGSKKGLWRQVMNSFIVFALSGLWHGANWTYVTWGLINAVYIAARYFCKQITKNKCPS